jgi:hypothetical protein
VRSFSALVAFDFQLISSLLVKGKSFRAVCLFEKLVWGPLAANAYELLGRMSVGDRNPDEVKVARIGCRILGMRGSGQNRVSAKAG